MAIPNSFLYLTKFLYGTSYAAGTQITGARAARWGRIYNDPVRIVRDAGITTVIPGGFRGVQGTVFFESDDSARTFSGLSTANGFIFEFFAVLTAATQKQWLLLKNCVPTIQSGMAELPSPDRAGLVPVIGVDFAGGIASGETEATVITYGVV